MVSRFRDFSHLLRGGGLSFQSGRSQDGADLGRDFRRAKVAAWVSTLLLVAAFAWRSAVGWMAYAAGEPKLFAASLITLMLAASLVSLVVLARRKD